MQRIMPHPVGIMKLKITHFHFPVSFFIVNSVVAHGKCKSVNIMMFNAVKTVQPFWDRMFLIAIELSNSISFLLFI